MKAICCVLTGLFLLAIASFGYSQSLADLAKKEKDRRQAVKTETKVITNDQVAKYTGTGVMTVTPPQASAADRTGVEKPAGEGETKPETEAGAAKTTPPSDEPTDFKGRPESYWKQTFADARQKVKDLENESNVLILKLNDLHNRFYRESDGFKQQDIQRQIQKAIYEQDLNKEKLAKAKADLVDLEQEARKSGALPGWIRSNNP
jgi:hypothetical protein